MLVRAYNVRQLERLRVRANSGYYSLAHTYQIRQNVGKKFTKVLSIVWLMGDPEFRLEP